jgi:hypothetical protein
VMDKVKVEDLPIPLPLPVHKYSTVQYIIPFSVFNRLNCWIYKTRFETKASIFPKSTVHLSKPLHVSLE